MPSLLQGDEDEERYNRNFHSWVLGLKFPMGAPPPPCSSSLGVFPDHHQGVFTNVHLGGGCPLDFGLTGAGAGGVILQWRGPSIFPWMAWYLA